MPFALLRLGAILCPGLDTGYGAKILPALREAVEQRQFDTAAAQILVAAEVLAGFADQVDRAAAAFSAPGLR